MQETRRGFFSSVAALAAASPVLSQGPGRGGPGPADSVPDSAIKVPQVKFGNAEISRLIVGCNMFYGYSHFNQIYSTVMREWFTPARVTETLLNCNKYGINTFNYFHPGRGLADYERFTSEGGKMHLIAQGNVDPAILAKTVKPLAIYQHGENTDRAYHSGKLESVRDYCKKARQQGVVVGVGSHMPEVLARVEDEGWDVDFYAGCVYNLRRTPEQFRKLLGGQLPEMPGEIYLQDDPPRMYRFMRQTRKPCFAFKILAAGRIRSAEEAFKQAFQSIKPIDGVFVGMFPRIKDEVRENAWWATRYGAVVS